MTALIYTIIVAVLVAADQLTKRAVVTHMELNQTIPAIDGLLNWTYILNDGASFGIMRGKTVFLLVITGVVMVALAFMLYSGRIKHLTGKIASLLILAGGIGNCIDRLFNDGKVVDFIDIDPIFSFPKFNVADCCVCVGGVLFCVYILFFYEESGKKKMAAAAEGAAMGGAAVAVTAEPVTDVQPAAEEPAGSPAEETSAPAAEGDDGTA